MSMTQRKSTDVDTAFVILAGGENRRMGKNKALLQLGGVTLVDHLAKFAKSQSKYVAVSVHETSEMQAYQPLLTDNTGERSGPLAGVLRGLEWLNSLPEHVHYLVTLPVDTPFVSRGLLPFLQQKISSPSLASYIRFSQRDHYLCALWTRKALPHVLTYLNEGHRSVRGAHRVLHSVAADYDPQPDDQAFSDLLFFNINTPEDYTEAQKRYGRL